MSLRTSRRLPGVSFEAQPPPLDLVLPRMDVTVFVGFAQSGPIDLPVPVEDVLRYQAIFGDDVELAMDPERHEPAYSRLGPAVRSFFRNGGRRCWIIRVAGGGAVANDFEIPGLWQSTQGDPKPARCIARSPGSWSDVLTVSTSLRIRPLQKRNLALVQNTVVLDLDLATAVTVGDTIRVSFKQDIVLMLVVTQAATIAPQAGSPPITPFLRVNSEKFGWFDVSGDAPKTSGAAANFDPIAVEAISFDLWFKRERERPVRLTNLALDASHPRFWGALPTDAQAYDTDENPARLKYPEVWEASEQTHFPFAASAADSALYFPAKMEATPEKFAGPIDQSADAAQRDGLDAFSSALFLDDALLDTSIEGFAAQADYVRYEAPDARKLRGIHAAYGIEEPSIIAVPDASHRPWQRRTTDEPFAPPETGHVPFDISRWHISPCDSADISKDVEVPPWQMFLNCDAQRVAPPVLDPPTVNENLIDHPVELHWSAPVAGVYHLEESAQPDFTGAVEVYTGGDTGIALARRASGVYYYRARVELDGQSSDWSNPRGVRVLGDRPYVLQALDRSTLLGIQRALMRMCAARGDMLAILTLPRDDRNADAIEHANHLTALNPAEAQRPFTSLATSPIGYGDAAALNYGALFHPWLIGQEDTSEMLVWMPPDGAIAGILARRAIARGAWVAPANELIQGVVALEPPISPASWQDLQDALVNLVRQEPAGFVTLDADTLSDDDDVRPINVRRLLMLLRRLALRRGVDYVFEPNNDALRRLVRRGFEAVMDDLFLRGAFAGGRAAEAYQVSTPIAPNDLDNGRFLLELRVAPSNPLSFISVRLVQSGDGRLVVEES